MFSIINSFSERQIFPIQSWYNCESFIFSFYNLHHSVSQCLVLVPIFHHLLNLILHFLQFNFTLFH